MNKKFVWMLVLIQVLIAIAPMAMAGGIPLPDHRPKGISQDGFKFMRQQLAGIKQFDLASMGIPVEKSLRLAGASGDPSHPFTLDAVSPRKMEAMLGWYRSRLSDWKLTDHTKGSSATLTSTKRSGDRIVIMRCSGGKFQLYTCGSVVRIYKMPGNTTGNVHIVSEKGRKAH